MFDPGPFDADIETIPHLILVIAVQLPPPKGGNVVRLHAVNGRAGQRLKDRGQVGTLTVQKYDSKQISRIVARASAELEAWRRPRLERRRYKFLYVDGANFQVRINRHHQVRKPPWEWQSGLKALSNVRSTQS